MFKLIGKIFAHEGPVRAVAVGPLGDILTASQDNSCKSWILGDQDYEQVGESIPHNHWVTAVTSLNSGVDNNFPNGCIITGCMDGSIRLYDPISHELLNTLVGHEKGVISFSWSCRGDLLSGSWDGTAKCWSLESGVCTTTFGPQENGVHVLGLENDIVATTSTGESVNSRPANFQVRLWNGITGAKHTTTTSAGEHTGPIRSICSLPNEMGFATTGNDGTLRFRSKDSAEVWGVNTHPMSPTQDQPSFILDCASLSPTINTPAAGATSKEMDITDSDPLLWVVSCGEDGSVNVWHGEELVQSLPHPQCVWGLCALSNGDFCTAGHDGAVRLFSRHAERQTLYGQEGALQTALEQEVEDSIRAKQKGPTAEDLAKAPQWSNRGSVTGTSEDQVGVFNKDGKLIAAQWSMVSAAWVEVGEVTGNADGGSVAGVAYDHIYPTEIETPGGLRKLDLGYNNGENPFAAAQRFINQNELEQGYLSQIADWIIARSGPNAPSATPTLDSPAAAAMTYPPPTPTPVVHSNSNAFQYVTFGDVPKELAKKWMTKVEAWNAEYSASGANCVMSGDELNNIRACCTVLSEQSYYHSSRISSHTHYKALATKMLQWGDHQMFPLFDLARMLVMHPSGADELTKCMPTPAFLTTTFAGTPCFLSHLLLRGYNALKHMFDALNNGHSVENSCFTTCHCFIKFLCNVLKVPATRTNFFSHTPLNKDCTHIILSLLVFPSFIGTKGLWSSVLSFLNNLSLGVRPSLGGGIVQEGAIAVSDTWGQLLVVQCIPVLGGLITGDWNGATASDTVDSALKISASRVLVVLLSSINLTTKYPKRLSGNDLVEVSTIFCQLQAVNILSTVVDHLTTGCAGADVINAARVVKDAIDKWQL